MFLFLITFICFLRTIIEASSPIPKVLFLTNSERGQANVPLAVAHALYAEYSSQVEVYFASFPAIASAVKKVSEQAGKEISFSEINGPSYLDALRFFNQTFETSRHEPGLKGMAKFNKILPACFVPWRGLDYVTVYQSVQQIIKEVDPSVVVLDAMFSPAVSAVLDTNVTRMYLSPNSLQDGLAARQPMAQVLWYYPVVGSGHSFPVPWYSIPANIFLQMRLAWTVTFDRHLRNTLSYIKSKGIQSRENLLPPHADNATFLIASSQALEYPLIVPENFVECGPIYMTLEPAESQDPELTGWLKQAPTVLIVLGSHTIYDESDASGMVQAVQMVLERIDRIQILWKAPLTDDVYISPLLTAINALKATGRVRIEQWLAADPAALLETGNIVCYVNHGGANSYLEAIGTGVPQVILSLWADTYDYALHAEWLGVGIWGNRDTAPYWTGRGIGDAVMDVLTQNHYTQRAKGLATPSPKQAGRFIAAHRIMKEIGGIQGRNQGWNLEKGSSRDEL